ncbi:MAG: type II/IV secretion system protein [Planctomycetaceae bacterium]|nr:type II/IV secretion system protein [Planctomycetaceae bacterium]
MTMLAERTTAFPSSPLRWGPEPEPLGDRLVRAGLLNAADLQSALSVQSSRHTRLGETLIELGFVSEEELLPLMGQHLDVASARLREGLIDPEVVRLIPRSFAEAHCVIALFRVRGELTVAMAEPQDLVVTDELERLTGLNIRPVLSLRAAIEKILPRCYEEDFAVDAVTADMDQDAVEVENRTIEVRLDDLQSMADGSPVISLVNYVIVHAVRQGSSDIHIEPGLQHSMVRFRVDGQLREVLRPRTDIHPAIVSRIKVMARMDIAEHRIPQDGRIRVRVEGREIDLRVSTLPTVLGEKVVMRVLDRRNVTFNLDQLGVPSKQLTLIRNMLDRPYGLVLVTGPTGSGKTTTLYSAMELIKSIRHNIVTVEDPVEYQLELINQVQTSAARSMTFANALRSILRQDPDVIMVGEIRDQETAEVAIQAALTGHLVLSTLHTNDSCGAVTRLLDMGVAGFKIAAALVGVVAQRLVRNICPNCRTHYYPTAEYLQMLNYQGDLRRSFQRGEGCTQCFDTGYRGRRGIYEVLSVNREIRELITRDADLEKLRDLHVSQGGTTLMTEGIRLAEEGLTSLEEVTSVAFFE